jgi:hypothetical protein
MANSRRIKVSGVKREVVDTEQIALVFWLQAKRILRERRANEQAARAKANRRKSEGESER